MELDVARQSEADRAEGQIDAFINRLDTKRRETEGERLEEELWQESARRHTERRREENRWAWVRHFDLMAANHAKLAEEYERRAEELYEANGHEKGEA